MHGAKLVQTIRERSAATHGEKLTKWNLQRRARATQEGWYLWFTCDQRTGRSLAQIIAKGKGEPHWARKPNRKDPVVRYSSDAEANEIVGQLADAGAEHAKLALYIIARLTVLNV